MTAVVAKLIWLVGVMQRGHFLSVFHQYTLSLSINGDVHHEEIKPIGRAGEDACFRTVAFSLIELHFAKLEHARVFWIAVVNIQLGCKGCRSTWVVSQLKQTFSLFVLISVSF